MLIMKRYFLSILVLLSCFSAFGQREIIVMDWDVVKDIVKEDPDDVKQLVSRLSLRQGVAVGARTETG